MKASDATLPERLIDAAAPRWSALAQAAHRETASFRRREPESTRPPGLPQIRAEEFRASPLRTQQPLLATLRGPTAAPNRQPLLLASHDGVTQRVHHGWVIEARVAAVRARHLSRSCLVLSVPKRVFGAKRRSSRRVGARFGAVSHGHPRDRRRPTSSWFACASAATMGVILKSGTDISPTIRVQAVVGRLRWRPLISVSWFGSRCAGSCPAGVRPGPCLRIVRAVYAAAADGVGVIAHRPGALERASLAMSDWHDTTERLAGAETPMVAISGDLGLTGLVTTIAGRIVVGAAAILAETGDRSGSRRPGRWPGTPGCARATTPPAATRARPRSPAAAGPACGWPRGGRCGRRCRTTR